MKRGDHPSSRERNNIDLEQRSLFLIYTSELGLVGWMWPVGTASGWDEGAMADVKRAWNSLGLKASEVPQPARWTGPCEVRARGRAEPPNISLGGTWAEPLVLPLKAPHVPDITFSSTCYQVFNQIRVEEFHYPIKNTVVFSIIRFTMLNT